MICPSAGSGGHPDNGSMIFYANDTGLQHFEKWWNKSKTVPFYLIGLLLPLLNFKSPSFFSKFNILGKPRHCVIELLCSGVHVGFCGYGLAGELTHQACSSMFTLFTCMLPCFLVFFVEFGTEENVDDHFKSKFFFLKMSYWISCSILTETLFLISSVGTIRGNIKISGGEIHTGYYRNSQS